MPCSATPTSTSTATRRRQLHLRGGTAVVRHRERGQRRARVREEAVVAGKPLPQPLPPPTRDFSTDNQPTRDRRVEACARVWPAQNPRVDWARTIGTRGAPSPQGRGRRLVSRGKAAPQDLCASGQGPTAQGLCAEQPSAAQLRRPCEARLGRLGCREVGARSYFWSREVFGLHSDNATGTPRCLLWEGGTPHGSVRSTSVQDGYVGLLMW